MTAVELLVELASLQTAFLTLDEAIKTTNRRVNALDNVVIPKLENTIAYIKARRAVADSAAAHADNWKPGRPRHQVKGRCGLKTCGKELRSPQRSSWCSSPSAIQPAGCVAPWEP